MQNRIQLLNRRYSALENERSSWMAHWQELSDVLLPRSGRYFTSDRNKGGKRHNNIYDNSGTKALRILAAGMMSGMTSPSRPWFRLAVADRDLMQYQPVKIWLNAVTETILAKMAQSNMYRVLHTVYEELGCFGTAAAFVSDSYETVAHLHPFTAGQYLIADDWDGNVVTLYREFETTVSALVKQFGIEQVSPRVKEAFERGNLDQTISVRHAIEPRKDRDFSKRDARNMPWQSVYWELGSGDSERVLRESGFKSFPCLVPRWMTAGGDVYGHSPGMDALGDIKQLQSDQYRKSRAIDYQTDPPLQVPLAMKDADSDFLPGGVSYYDPLQSPKGAVQTAFQVNLDLRHLLADIQDIRGRIHSAFFSDVFMMISQQDNRMTATEVAARHEEKMVMLGPVVERLNNELLDPMVEIFFERMLIGGLLPPAPEELQGADINIEYVSILAQAQQAATVNGVDRLVGSIGNMATIKPDVLDRFNVDHWVELYADKLGVDPELIVPGEKAALIRKQRAQQMAMAQQQDAMQRSAEVAGRLGNLPTTPGTMAGDFIDGQFNRA